MLSQLLSTISAITVLTFHTSVGAQVPATQVLATKQYSLADRYSNTFVNDVFADNIMLTLSYMAKQTTEGKSVDWGKVTGPFTYKMVLNPGQTFAFHDQVLPEYTGKVDMTTNAHFDSYDGFKSDGWLVADGVCHLASFMNVVAKDAGLKVEAPTRHDFAKIPEVDPKDGVSIFSTSSAQNLYITNTKSKPIAFVFKHEGSDLKISVEEVN
jgi:hypothetical protein